MNTTPESKVIQKFQRHLNRKRLTRKLKLVYRVSGGMPSERLEEEIELLGNGEARVRVRDQLRAPKLREASTKLRSPETREILRQIEAGLESLVPRSEARFVPDSVVGSITLEVDGDEETFYFLVDEEQREAQGTPIAAEMDQAIQRLRHISHRLLERDKGKTDE